MMHYNRTVHRWLTIGMAAAIVLAAATSEVEARRYFIGARGGLATLAGGERPHFYHRAAYGFEAGFDLNARWTFEGSLTLYDLYNDPTLENSFSFSGDKANATARFKGTRIGADLMTELYSPAPWFHLRGGLGGGLLIWKMVDPVADTTLESIGSRNETIDFSSTEIFLSARVGAEFRLASRLSVILAAHGDYLTGAGTDFADAVGSDRDHWLLSATAAVRYSFGGVEERDADKWPDKTALPPSTTRGLDSDGDGVADSEDRCQDTPPDVLVDQFGCALDGDGDGIMDGQDHCPGTDVRARGLVDIYGCPVDSDFDGVPDYRDECPNNRSGAVVDDRGCPADDDGDGVPNGLDDCPNTLFGVPVDRYGCIDLAMFDEPMVLNIDYDPGSFEIDHSSQERLRSLARVLMVAPQIRAEITGYTDNIGPEEANRALSEKRANRVRDFLVAQGVDENRIRAEGRGESNFVATNDTAEGRAMNRRIEIVFHK